LNLSDGGFLGRGFEVGAPSVLSTNVELNVAGGAVGDRLRVFAGGTANVSGGFVGGLVNVYDGGTLNLSGGSIGRFFEAFSGSAVNITGGTVDAFFQARDGSTVNMSGGSVGPYMVALPGSKLNISGGVLGRFFDAYSGSIVNLSGGAMGANFDALAGSDLNIFGGEFHLDGVAIGGLDTPGGSLSIQVPQGSTLSGTLADGTPLAISSLDFDTIADGALTLHAATLPPVGPKLITASAGPLPLGIRGGQRMVVDAGGVVGENFHAGRGSVVQVEPGADIGDNFEAIGAVVLVSGGSVGNFFDAFGGSGVKITGGTVGFDFDAMPGSSVEISGGGVGDYFDAYRTSTVHVTGGTVGNRFDALPGSNVTIAGGAVGHSFSAHSGSKVRLTGGTVGNYFDALGGSNVVITGGVVGAWFGAFGGSGVRISGGVIGDGFTAVPGSRVEISGGEFRLNGALVAGLDKVGDNLQVSVPSGAVLSGTLADGRQFAFSTEDRDYFAPDVLTLRNVALPPKGPMLILASNNPVPPGIRDGQLVVVDAGGMVGDNFGAGWGSAVRIESGGAVGNNFEAIGADVDIVGGIIGTQFDAFYGTRVNLSGGTVGDVFEVFSGSSLNLAGGEFRINGVLLDGLRTIGSRVPIDVPAGALLSGTLADGTPVAFSARDGDHFADGALTLTAAALPAIGPSRLTVSADPLPWGIRHGQMLLVDAGGTVPANFNAGWGSVVRVQPGGRIGANLEATGATIELSGGVIDDDFDAFTGSTVTLTSGAVGDRFAAFDGSLVNMRGGAIGDEFDATDGSIVNIFAGVIGDGLDLFSGSRVSILGGSIGSGADAFAGSTLNVFGGSVGENFDAYDGSAVNMSGGSMSNGFEALAGSTVNLFGKEFLIEGAPIDGLVLGEPFTVINRTGTLSGVFADGGEFAFPLEYQQYIEGFHPASHLTVTLVPNASLGDTNADGIVDMNDLNNVRNHFGAAGAADGTLAGDTVPFDGQVNIDDLNRVRNHFGAGTNNVVPEPAGIVLVLMGCAICSGMVGARRGARGSR
jgi:hypothetical protein